MIPREVNNRCSRFTDASDRIPTLVSVWLVAILKPRKVEAQHTSSCSFQILQFDVHIHRHARCLLSGHIRDLLDESLDHHRFRRGDNLSSTRAKSPVGVRLILILRPNNAATLVDVVVRIRSRQLFTFDKVRNTMPLHIEGADNLTLTTLTLKTQVYERGEIGILLHERFHIEPAAHDMDHRFTGIVFLITRIPLLALGTLRAHGTIGAILTILPRFAGVALLTRRTLRARPTLLDHDSSVARREGDEVDEREQEDHDEFGHDTPP
jgi:hypothetical protein